MINKFAHRKKSIAAVLVGYAIYIVLYIISGNIFSFFISERLLAPKHYSTLYIFCMGKLADVTFLETEPAQRTFNIAGEFYRFFTTLSDS